MPKVIALQEVSLTASQVEAKVKKIIVDVNNVIAKIKFVAPDIPDKRLGKAFAAADDLKTFTKRAQNMLDILGDKGLL